MKGLHVRDGNPFQNILIDLLLQDRHRGTRKGTRANLYGSAYFSTADGVIDTFLVKRSFAAQANSNPFENISDDVSGDNREGICSVNVLEAYEGACQTDIFSQNGVHMFYVTCPRVFCRSCVEFLRSCRGGDDQGPSENVF